MQIQIFNQAGSSASAIAEMPVIDPPTTDAKRQAKAWLDQAVAASKVTPGFFAVCGDLDKDTTDKVLNIVVGPMGAFVTQNIYQE